MSDKVVSLFSKASDADSGLPICEFCFGTGTRVYPGRGAAVCQCQRTDIKSTLLKAARIPARFRQHSLDTFTPNHDSQSFALSYAKSFVEHYPAVDKGLLLMGGAGLGKTHLATAILKALIEIKGIPGLFLESGSLMKAIQDSYNSISQTSEMRVLAPVYETDVLVLDELGTAIPTEWVRDTLYQVINTRYNNRRVTIFTTNYLDEVGVEEDVKALQEKKRSIENGGYRSGTPTALKQIDKQINRLLSTQTLEDRIGTTLRSRLYEMCLKIEIKGQDYRRGMVGRVMPK